MYSITMRSLPHRGAVWACVTLGNDNPTASSMAAAAQRIVVGFAAAAIMRARVHHGSQFLRALTRSISLTIDVAHEGRAEGAAELEEFLAAEPAPGPAAD